ncbi:LysR substrate-binding domain-containing protein [Pigmentiphaga sp.]|uniref:LysR family transcriptional regulator n=1 Tax=Pigmentiphaga sp. TaxID=1977564 RepID=UPI00128E72C3|nr:LysR substrate-binding domain-containing protein [Pigmentiphaga sp.]MPS30092.1 LysR family transcriptional regulator [Alcaligenaceae bacterium SAGV5]MPS55206.1 LysR family transcriptional regulator [Alcaligenaceae bacterium SAGV3]MPT59499.1 LysR family transcriptional regulator [Alcaligenaceae bacterium]
MIARSPLSLSHLKFRQLMLIDLLVRHGTLHKAARHLAISQPAATAMLNDLEALLGVSLFLRGRQGVVPTPATHALLGRCRTILNEFDEWVSNVADVAQGQLPVLRVGVVAQAYLAYLPHAIEFFLEAGGTPIQTREGTGRALIDALLNGELECVIGRLPNDGLASSPEFSQLDFVPLYTDQISVVAHPAHPLVDRAQVSYQDLVDHKWVLQRRDSSVRRAFAEGFTQRGLRPPEPLVETSSFIQNLTVVAHSSLLTVAPQRAARFQENLGIVRLIDADLDLAPMHVSFISRKTAARNPMLTRFRESFVRSLEQGMGEEQ